MKRQPRPDTPATVARKARRARAVMDQLQALIHPAPVKPDAILPPGFKNIDDDPMGRRSGDGGRRRG